MKREGLLEGPTKKRAAVVRLNVREAHFDVAPETLAAATSFQAVLAGDTPMAAAHTVTIGADVASASADDPGDDLVWLQQYGNQGTHAHAYLRGEAVSYDPDVFTAVCRVLLV